jgi:MOSC domain-containing protein YiiM
MVAAGDRIEVLSRDAHAVSVSEFVRVYAVDKDDYAAIRRLMKVEGLPAKWRERFAQRLSPARPAEAASRGSDGGTGGDAGA